MDISRLKNGNCVWEKGKIIWFKIIKKINRVKDVSMYCIIIK